MFFGALGEFAIGQVPTALAPLTQANDVGIGPLGQYALGQQGMEVFGGANIFVPSLAISFVFGAPSIRSGSRIVMPALNISVNFGTPEINARIRRVKSQAILS